MNFRSPKDLPRRRSPPGVDLTPMVDMVFNLLLFFLLTSAFVLDKKPAIPIDVPEARSAVDVRKKDEVTVHISKDGSLFLDTERLGGPEDLLAAFRRVAGRDPATMVLIRADAQSPHGLVVKVMDAARQAGLGRFGIVTRGE